MARTRSQAVTCERAPVARQVIENSGLCGTCDVAPTCIYRGDAEHPVLECEEFTHQRAGASGPAIRRLSLAPNRRPDAREAEPARLMGLCLDCERRADCTFEKGEGGVWRCEEYR